MKNFDLILARFGALVCALKGHRRRKRHLGLSSPDLSVIAYRCPRCGNVIYRQARKAKG